MMINKYKFPLFGWEEKNNESIEKVVYLNILLCPYYIRDGKSLHFLCPSFSLINQTREMHMWPPTLFQKELGYTLKGKGE